MTQNLPQIYTANHSTFPIQIHKITVQIYGKFWVTQYIFLVEAKSYKCAVVLLNSGADISLKNGAGQSPLRLAQYLGDREGFILNIQLSVRSGLTILL